MNTIKRSETFRRVLRFRNRLTNTAPDLTGCTARCQMRSEPGGELLATAMCYVSPDSGSVTAVFSREMTADLPLGKVGYDIWLIGDGEQKPIYTEEVMIVDSYTDMTEN